MNPAPAVRSTVVAGQGLLALPPLAKPLIVGPVVTAWVKVIVAPVMKTLELVVQVAVLTAPAVFPQLPPAPVLFVIGSSLALLINYPNLKDQQKVVRTHGTNIFLVSSMIFAAGIFSGILAGSKMIDAMAAAFVALIPQGQANLLPLLTAITSMPASLIFTPDAYYFGVVPVLSEAAQHYHINPLEIGRAALLGQMTVGFPLSPLTASTFLLIGLCEVDLGDHQRFIFKWAMGTTLVMTFIALLTGSIHL